MADNLLQTIRIFGTLAVTASMPLHRALEAACQLVENEAKEAIGTYRYSNWPQLAESTQRDRVHQGFPANEPLLRTGEMRDSIEHTVQGHVGYVGSNNMKLVWHELGTSRMPPRPVLMNAAIAREREIHELTGRIYQAHILAGLHQPLPYGYAHVVPGLARNVQTGPTAITGRYGAASRGIWVNPRH